MDTIIKNPNGGNSFGPRVDLNNDTMFTFPSDGYLEMHALSNSSSLVEGELYGSRPRSPITI